MLLPGDVYSPPVRGVIATGADTVIVDGTAVSNTAPSSNMYADISTVTNGFDNTTDPVTFVAADGDFWRVGDMVRSNAEVAEITAIDGNNITVRRGMLGTSAGSHGDGETLRLQFSNDYHDIDKYTVAQTDSDGKFKCTNFFGLGRAASGVQGIVPGSVALKFYEPGYQSLGLSGITNNTNSGLTAGETLKLDITVDGGTLFQDLTFTLDTSNVNFGGTNGVIDKIQAALDTQYYTAGNLFEKKVRVGIVNGDIRFTSGSHLSTSAILLADTGDSDTFIDATANGRIPTAIGTGGGLPEINSPVAARLPDDVRYDPVTYSSIPNEHKFVYDDGLGNLFGAATGTINYETGAIDFRNAPANAEFVHSVLHTSAFSGKLNPATADRTNSLVAILANTPSQKWNGSVTLRTF